MAYPVFEVAKIIARHCQSIPGVDEVWLFGSVASFRTSYHDINLVLVVDQGTSSRFVAAVNNYVAKINREGFDSFYDLDEVVNIIFERRRIAEKILGAPINPVTFSGGRFHLEGEGLIDETDGRHYALAELGTMLPIDVFLFPVDWRTNPEEVEQTLPIGSSGLVVRMAQDARLYDPNLGDFAQI